MKRSDISDREALEACWGEGTGRHYSPLARLTERYPQKLAERKLEHLDARGLIEWGTSIAYPWRTPEGEAELARLTAGTTAPACVSLTEGEQ